MKGMREEFKQKRKDALKAAKDLLYDEKYISQLQTAKTEGELYRILKNARKEKFE